MTFPRLEVHLIHISLAYLIVKANKGQRPQFYSNIMGYPFKIISSYDELRV